MLNPTWEKEVYYWVLEGSRYLFADEVKKKLFLDRICEAYRGADWLVYAFCLMDDRAYFVIETDEMDSVAKSLLVKTENLFEQPGQLVSGQIRRLDSLTEIAAYCRMIHLIPLAEGYVSRIRDYWWSSYLTYLGDYDWEMVNCQVFLLYFSADTELARKKFKQFHRTKNALDLSLYS